MTGNVTLSYTTSLSSPNGNFASSDPNLKIGGSMKNGGQIQGKGHAFFPLFPTGVEVVDAFAIKSDIYPAADSDKKIKYKFGKVTAGGTGQKSTSQMAEGYDGGQSGGGEDSYDLDNAHVIVGSCLLKKIVGDISIVGGITVWNNTDKSVTIDIMICFENPASS
jgi:hypothetical protein